MNVHYPEYLRPFSQIAITLETSCKRLSMPSYIRIYGSFTPLGTGGGRADTAEIRFCDVTVAGQQSLPSGCLASSAGGSDELVSSANPSSPAIVTSRPEKRANAETFRKWRRLWRNSMSSSCFPCSFQLQMVLCSNTNKQS